MVFHTETKSKIQEKGNENKLPTKKNASFKSLLFFFYKFPPLSYCGSFTVKRHMQRCLVFELFNEPLVIIDEDPPRRLVNITPSQSSLQAKIEDLEHQLKGKYDLHTLLKQYVGGNVLLH